MQSIPSPLTTLLAGLRRSCPGRLTALAACALALPLASGSAAAQSLVNGGVVSGAISPVGDVDTYTFSASAGEGFQIQVVDVNTTALHPLIRVFDPSGTLLQSAQSPTVAAIFRTAATTGTYTLEVSDWNTTGTGSYDVHYAKAPGANEGGALVNGGSVAGTIDLGDLDSFTFTAGAGEGVQLQMADMGQTGFHPLMRLYSPSGAYLQGDQSPSVAAIFFTAQTSGTYTLVVSDWNQAGNGDYEIHYTRAPGANEGGALLSGGSVTGAIDLGDLDSFTFTAGAGEGIQLQLADTGLTGFHPLMRLYSPSGAYLQGDQSPSVAAIFFTAQTIGTYTLVISDWNQAGTGNYELFFTRRPSANEGGELINGGSVMGTIDLGDLDSYTFPALAGEGIQLQMADTGQTGFHPLMRLYSPSGTYLQGDQSPSVAAIFFTAQTSGTYTLVISDWNQAGTGDYEVHYTRAPGANEHGALINGGFVAGAIGLGDLDSYTFTAGAGEGVQLQVADVGQTGFHPLMRLYSPSGAFLQAAQGPSVAAIFFAAQTAGTYTLVVSDWNQAGTGDYAVHYTRAPGANEHGKLVHGDNPSGTIELGDLDSFTFSAFAGEKIELVMTEVNGTSLHPLLRLHGPAGSFLQAAQGPNVATLVHTAQTTGTYTLVASDWNLAGTGDYGLALSRGVVTYCTAGTTASGCTSLMSAYGDPSASAPSGFLVRATGGEGNQIGVFFFGTGGHASIPWGTSSSFLCVAPPIQRTPAAHGGGSNGACNAAASLDLNQLFTANPAIEPPAGSLVQVQYWFRDPLHPSGQGSSMSNALEFTLHP